MAKPDPFVCTHPREWLLDLAARLGEGKPQVLITVVQTQGSTPRDTGARMWVGSNFIVDTIGGGHLEWKAISKAREMLGQDVVEPCLERYPLGPSLGQCCGGVVWLMFERLERTDATWCTQIASDLARGMSTERRVRVMSADSGVMEVVDTWSVPSHHIIVCGAGHVGSAVVRLLADLPVQVTWLDPRDDCWPSDIPANVQIVRGDADDVSDMPDSAYWLILTHNHALDLAIIDAIFSDKSFEFLGLIGSKSKKARFASRLSRRHKAELVGRICCPVGMVRTSSKSPSVIAISIVAQLLDMMSA